MKKNCSKLKEVRTNKIFPFLGISLMCFLLMISVGFSALSTSLTINGQAAFVPVGMIRVLSMTQGSLVGATEVSHSITSDSIKATIDLNSASSTATYTVVIKNLGQVDYKLDRIIEDLYSNNQIEYELNGLAIGDIIAAGESKTFQVTFKYKDNIQEELVSRLNSTLRFEFVEDEDPSPFPVVYSHVGACEFNGTSNITGIDCQEYWNTNHIDTGIALYNQENWQKDYEIGFIIDSYVQSDQVNQAVFVNTKYEKESLKWPGLVARNGSKNNIMEITQSINKGAKKSAEISTSNLPLEIKIVRANGIVYYSVNSGPLIKLQDMRNFNQQFDVTTWFGAAADENGNPFRNLNATLSNMYIKLGDYQEQMYTITFDPNGGTVSEPTRQVSEFATVGTLPIPTNGVNDVFDGWYTDRTYSTPVTADTAVTGDTTFYAKWITTDLVEMDGNYYSSIAAALADVEVNGAEKTIRITNDIQDEVFIPVGKSVVFDFENHTISNSKSSFVIENRGNLKIVSGSFINNATFSVINNEATGNLVITGGDIVGTSTKQGIYNNGGHVTISGNPTITTASSIRPAVHNISSGTLVVTGGTITSNGQNGIGNENSTLVIGTHDGTIDSTSPIIIGKTYGVSSNIAFSLYDGTLKGRNQAVNSEANITTMEDNSVISKTTEQISGVTYHTLTLEASN